MTKYAAVPSQEKGHVQVRRLVLEKLVPDHMAGVGPNVQTPKPNHHG